MTSEKTRSLLIVEDDLALQKQIKWSLDRFDSVTAHDRESALLQLRKSTPAVVTMDLGLPPDADSVSEGFRLLEQMMAFDPDIKVIVLTGQNDQANALRAVAMGAYDFFAKPFEPELLNRGGGLSGGWGFCWLCSSWSVLLRGKNSLPPRALYSSR